MASFFDSKFIDLKETRGSKVPDQHYVVEAFCIYKNFWKTIKEQKLHEQN